jgi:hypothetical protein
MTLQNVGKMVAQILNTIAHQTNKGHLKVSPCNGILQQALGNYQPLNTINYMTAVNRRLIMYMLFSTWNHN